MLTGFSQFRITVCKPAGVPHFTIFGEFAHSSPVNKHELILWRVFFFRFFGNQWLLWVGGMYGIAGPSNSCLFRAIVPILARKDANFAWCGSLRLDLVIFLLVDRNMKLLPIAHGCTVQVFDDLLSYFDVFEAHEAVLAGLSLLEDE